MTYPCQVIKDLLPLYQDEVCSEESRAAVDAHLAECGSCREYLESVKSTVLLPTAEKAGEEAKASVLSAIRKKLFRKKVIVSAVSVLCSAAVMLGAFMFVFQYDTPIAYSEGLVKVEMAYDGVIDAFYQGRDYFCAHGMDRTLTVDGQQKNIAYIYYSGTIWTRNLSRAHVPGTLQFSVGNSIMVDYGKNGEPIYAVPDISAVYYLPGDYSELISMDEDEFAQASKDAVLLWEK